MPTTKRYLAVRAIIEREAAPLLEDLGEEAVAKLEELALTPGGKAKREPLSEEYLATLGEKKELGRQVYGMFRRACRGEYARYGRLYYVDETGAEVSVKEYCDALGTNVVDLRGKTVADIRKEMSDAQKARKAA